MKAGNKRMILDKTKIIMNKTLIKNFYTLAPENTDKNFYT